MTNIYIKTHGCSANSADSESMAGLLTKAGFKIVSDIEHSEVNILNICTVKGLHVPLKEIEEFTEQFPDKKLVVAGCISKDIILRIRNLIK